MDKTGTGRLMYSTTVDVIWTDEDGKETTIKEDRTYFLDLGIITRIEEVFSKSTSATPRTSMSAEDTFVLETGSSLTLTISFDRVNPFRPNDNHPNYWIQRGNLPYDPYANTPDGQGDFIEDVQGDGTMMLLTAMRMNGSTRWSNNKWYREMTSAVDRWQTKTDGFKFIYIPDQNGDVMDNPYIPAYNYLNGYVKSLRRVYKAGDPNRLSCTLEFHVGTIHLDLSEGDELEYPYSHLVSPSAPFAEMTISSMHSPAVLTLHSVNKQGSSTEESFLDSDSDFTITAGPNNPFECVEFAVSKYHMQMAGGDSRYMTEGATVSLRAFADQYGVVKGDTDKMRPRPGLDDAIRQEFIIRSATLSSGTVRTTKYKVQAYCREASLTSEMTMTDIAGAHPWEVIEGVLTGAYSSLALMQSIPEGYIRHNLDLDHLLDQGEGGGYFTIDVDMGIDLWTLLKTCANLLHAKVFFADGHMYLVDYSVRTLQGVESIQPPLEDLGHIDMSNGDMRGRLSGMVSDKTSVSSDNMVNFITVGLTVDEIASKLESRDPTIGRWDSISLYGYYESTADVDDHIKLDAKGYEAYRVYMLDYYAYPQTPLKFTLKELYSSKTDNGYWRVTYPPAAFAREIKDEVGGYHNLCQPRTEPNEESISTDNGEYLSITYGPSEVSRPSTLMLSSYKRNLWSCQTEYTFGEIGETSLSKILSK